jgi:hypothetical protein
LAIIDGISDIPWIPTAERYGLLTPHRDGKRLVVARRWLTNAFSKKLENFKAAVALHYAYYNFVKSNIAIRCTPAMAAGVTNTFWTVRDLVEMIEA